MALEIEHKYLVKKDIWKNVNPEQSISIQQAYLSTNPNKTIRVRTKGNHAYLTIKGKTNGASRPEYEFEIPIKDAQELIRDFCNNLIEKTRHIVTYQTKVWEVDEFEGLNQGLIVAEIELSNENESYALPEWVDKEVTNDNRYSNSNLAEHPFTKW